MNKNLFAGLIALLCVGAILYSQESNKNVDLF